MNITRQIQKIIAYVENPRIPFLYYALIFLSCITLRNFGEIFSDQAKIPFKLYPGNSPLYLSIWRSLSISLLHYYVFWIALFLGLALIVYLLTKENVNKILRTLFSFSFILNFTPLGDLVFGKGRDMNISYLYPKNLAEFIRLPVFITPGMKITSTIGILLVFFYVWTKTNNLKRGFLGSIGLYFLLALTAILPFVLKASHPVPLIRFLLLAIFLELLVIFYLLKREYLRALFKDVRLLRVLHFDAMFFLGILLARQPLLKTLAGNWDCFLLTKISASLAWLAAIMFNNLEDYEIDKISNPLRPLVSASITAQDYKKIAQAAIAASAIFALGVNFQTFFLVLLLMGNSFIYSLPPLKCKRIPVFSKVFIAFDSLIVVMLGYIFAGAELLKFPAILNWYFLIFISLCMNFIDLKDYAGDKQAGILTLPVIMGIRKAKLLIGFFFLVSYGVLGCVFLDRRLIPAGLILGAVQFFLINKKVYREKLILLTYLIGMAGLFYYLGRYY